MIFKQIRIKLELIDHAPTGTIVKDWECYVRNGLWSKAVKGEKYSMSQNTGEAIRD